MLRLADLRRGLDGKRREAQRAEQALKVQQVSLGSLLEKRQMLASKTEADRRAEEGRIASLSRDAKDLRDLMARIEAEQRAEEARQAAAAKAARAKVPVSHQSLVGPSQSSRVTFLKSQKRSLSPRLVHQTPGFDSALERIALILAKPLGSSGLHQVVHQSKNHAPLSARLLKRRS